MLLCAQLLSVNKHNNLLSIKKSSHLLIIIFFFHFIFAVPITPVRAVLARQAMLPCDIQPNERDDVVYMVLWYREGDNEPLYRYVLLLVH